MESKKEKVLRATYLPEDLKRGFASRCALEGLTQQEVVRALVEAYVAGRIDGRGQTVKGKGR
jgi:hypothetical protein